MKKKYLLTLLVTLVTLSSFAQSKGYNVYHNDRFGFCVLYPVEFKKGLAPTNNDGRSFSDRQNNRILAYGGLVVYEDALKQEYEMAQKDKKVTYKVRSKNAFVVSGFDQGRIFYQKTILRKEQLFTVYFNYLASEKKLFDAIIKRVTKTFPACDF